MNQIPISLNSQNFPNHFRQWRAHADPSWHPILDKAWQAMENANPNYTEQLLNDHFLPTQHRLFAAFAQPLTKVRYVLVGEGPYPRAESATGVCFMDGAVHELWSAQGLSRKVNRATSLRNFMKMLLVAEGALDAAHTSGDALQSIALQALQQAKQPQQWIQTLAELQANLTKHGFLLLNATLVYRARVKPSVEARSWLPFLRVILQSLWEYAQTQQTAAPTLVLWGKIAEVLHAQPISAEFPQVFAEHPYNLSFIQNKTMQDFFRPMRLLHPRAA